ncbi:MAG: tetraacyldisaccharide 4'-kinase [Desulfobacterales bacterium]|jgi:tetraacyldisaccharide 4'-kinase
MPTHAQGVVAKQQRLDIKTMILKIQRRIQSESRHPWTVLDSFLLGLSFVYRAGVGLRTAGYQGGVFKSKKLPCTVISVGNITAGGTGKTPMTLRLAGKVHEMGYRSVVISRGYRSGAEKPGGIVSNGREILMNSQQAGDEPIMLAARLKTIGVPVLIGKNRYRSGLLALAKFKPDVIILDDGFQHLGLARDINVVLLDGNRPFGNNHLLPRGPLREPVSSLVRADMFILTRFESGSGILAPETLKIIKRYLKGRQLYKTRHVPILHKWIKAGTTPGGNHLAFGSAVDFSALKACKVFAFCGIANNEDFKHTLEDLAGDLLGFMGFPDHHAYSGRDLSKISRCASDAGADVLCTTAKDYVRIDNKATWPMDLAVIGVEVTFGEDEANFLAELSLRLADAGKAQDLSPGE